VTTEKGKNEEDEEEEEEEEELHIFTRPLQIGGSIAVWSMSFREDQEPEHIESIAE